MEAILWSVQAREEFHAQLKLKRQKSEVEVSLDDEVEGPDPDLDATGRAQLSLFLLVGEQTCLPLKMPLMMTSVWLLDTMPILSALLLKLSS